MTNSTDNGLTKAQIDTAINAYLASIDPEKRDQQLKQIEQHISEFRGMGDDEISQHMLPPHIRKYVPVPANSDEKADINNFAASDQQTGNPTMPPENNDQPTNTDTPAETRGQIGDNQIVRSELRGFVERIERLEEEKKTISDDVKVVMAEAKARGFDTKAIRYAVKMRKKTPSEIDDTLAMQDLYLSSLGMRTDVPLFAHVGLMDVDISSREQVINAFEKLVPTQGEIIIKVGAPVRLYRVEGKVVVEDYIEPVTGETRNTASVEKSNKAKPDAPDCTVSEAEQIGRTAFRDDQPITSNPFPWDDDRRAAFDKGWCDESGTDGMGPEDD